MTTHPSPQHPAVVLRSHFVHLRALLAAALIAVICLTVAVVALATDDRPASSIQPLSAAAAPNTDTVAPPGMRYDGGPDEGSRGSLPAPDTRYDGGPDEGSRGLGH
jgi:hypothetical protein